MKMVVMAPKKHPTLYAPTDIPGQCVRMEKNSCAIWPRLTLDGRSMILLGGIETKFHCGSRSGIKHRKCFGLYVLSTALSR